jgi:hypothetical protein
VNRRVATTFAVLAIVVAASSPLVAEFAMHHGQPGLLGAPYPVMTAGLAIAVSLFIVHERLAGRAAPWWAWVAVAIALAVTAFMAIAEAVAL